MDSGQAARPTNAGGTYAGMGYGQTEETGPGIWAGPRLAGVQGAAPGQLLQKIPRCPRQSRCSKRTFFF